MNYRDETMGLGTGVVFSRLNNYVYFSWFFNILLAHTFERLPSLNLVLTCRILFLTSLMYFRDDTKMHRELIYVDPRKEAPWFNIHVPQTPFLSITIQLFTVAHNMSHQRHFRLLLPCIFVTLQLQGHGLN